MIHNCRASSISLKGKRKRIEDFYYINPESGIFIVADGVADAPDGDLASRFIVNHLAESLEKKLSEKNKTPEETKEILRKETIRTGNRFMDYVKENQDKLEYLGQPKTTLTAVALADSSIVYIHVGDSALFTISSKNTIRRITDVVPFFIGSILDIEDFMGLFQKGIYKLDRNDTGFILFTDGFYNHLIDKARREKRLNRSYTSLRRQSEDPAFEKELNLLLKGYENPAKVIDSIRDECLDAGDNVTVIYGLL